MILASVFPRLPVVYLVKENPTSSPMAVTMVVLMDWFNECSKLRLLDH